MQSSSTRLNASFAERESVKRLLLQGFIATDTILTVRVGKAMCQLYQLADIRGEGQLKDV